MARHSTSKLYVNLSASQTRKRLKSHGFGVRRVEAVDRNQAVVFHTATGQHLRELESLFVDVTTSSQHLDVPVENLRNLGPASAAWLQEVGVLTRSDLRRMGPVAAFQLVRQRFPNASLNLLWALAAALQDKDWRELADSEKDQLRVELGTDDG
ncbi:MAG: TfoX/Sxy family DNA transformation protein [Pirellulaceae bacterium]